MGFLSILSALLAAYGGPVGAVVLAGQIIGRAIPDSKGGVLGVVRKVAKGIGMYRTPDLNNLNAVVAANASTLAPIQGTTPIVNLGNAAQVVESAAIAAGINALNKAAGISPAPVGQSS